MTENQKKLVQIYREKGMSYKAVADSLSVSINTIKTFCKRNGLGGVRTGTAGPGDGMVTACRCCGKPVRQNPGRKQIMSAFVNTVGRHSSPMETAIVNTAAIDAM